jgi:aryl-alcohol dehydrogenase-like predicted oxidoreductase
MVSAVGFGGIPIQRLTDEQAVAVVQRCLGRGVTFLDTANAYSTSEGRIGQAIAGRREELIIATKSAARDGKTVRQHLSLSLKQLGVETIDLYQLHNVSSKEQYEKSIPHFLKIVESNTEDEAVLYHLGIAYFKTGKFTDAIKMFRKAIKLNPEDKRSKQMLDIALNVPGYR